MGGSCGTSSCCSSGTRATSRAGTFWRIRPRGAPLGRRWNASLSRPYPCARLTAVRILRTIRFAPWLLALGLPGLLAFHAPLAAENVPPLRYTLKTIENEAGVRVILEFTRKPVYEARADSKRVYIALREGSVEPPFKKRDYDGRVLEKVKFIEGLRTAEIVFYTGEEFSSFSTFEMGEPFRIVLDLRRSQGPPLAISIPAPGSIPGSQPAPGSSPKRAGGPAPPSAG